MARANNMSAKDLAAIAALVVEQLQAGNAPAKAEEAPAEPESVPFLSCWNASRVSVKKGAFTHAKRDGSEKSYVALTPEQAHAMLDANIAAGRLYAIPA